MIPFIDTKTFCEEFQNTNCRVSRISCESCYFVLSFLFYYPLGSKQRFHFLSSHTDSFLYRYMNNASQSGLLKMSSVFYLVSIKQIRIIFFCAKPRKWWYLIVIYFPLGDNLLDSEMAIQTWLSSNTLLNTFGFGRCISKTKDDSVVDSLHHALQM